MFLETGDKKECTGCGVCQNICKSNAICMTYDEKGFLYPRIDRRKCKNCGACIHQCSVNFMTKERKEGIILCGKHKNSKTVMKSSSGGAFTALCQTFLKDETAYRIYGAVMRKNGYVEHVGIHDIRNIDIMRKSKYVQSDTAKVYKEIKQNLKMGIKVVYSGVPCQIAALRAYLQREYCNLLCIELLCRGVSSPLILERYIHGLEAFYHKKIKKVDMRDKLENRSVNYTRIYFEDNTSIANGMAQIFMQFYRTSRYYRDSCYVCKRRISDKKYIINGDAVIGDWYNTAKDEKSSFLLVLDPYKINIDVLNTYFEGKRLDYRKVIAGNRDFLNVNLPKIRSYQWEKIDIIHFISIIIKNRFIKV